jgi:hypothetical protein
VLGLTAAPRILGVLRPSAHRTRPGITRLLTSGNVPRHRGVSLLRWLLRLSYPAFGLARCRALGAERDHQTMT